MKRREEATNVPRRNVNDFFINNKNLSNVIINTKFFFWQYFLSIKKLKVDSEKKKKQMRQDQQF